MKDYGLLTLPVAIVAINNFLDNKQDIKFKANFPVCEVIDYIDSLKGVWDTVDSNKSGSCHDMWFTYEDFTVQICTYHGDVCMYVEEE